jgi:chlorobactene glucosyltransferase
LKLGSVLTHACAGVALFYAVRSARYAAGWIRVPIVTESDDATLVSIVVPARDEERSIERCVRSLLAQDLSNFEVIVVDDRSTDRTGEILRELASDDNRLRVITGETLPEGWVGKPWALVQGARLARGSWLLFTDADSYHEPFATRSVLAFAQAAEVDAVTIATRQELGTFWERAVLPAILGIVLFTIGTFDEINDPTNPVAIANGQYIFISRRAYTALGGHGAVRGQIVEDLEFARFMKRDGRFRMILAGGEDLASVRMYRSLREIWDGFTKNVYLGAEGRPERLLGGVIFLVALSVGPPLLALNAGLRRRPLEAVEAIAASATVIATATWAVGQTKMSRWLGVFAPLGFAMLAGITVNSTIRVLSGRGVSWRGRNYSGHYEPTKTD